MLQRGGCRNWQASSFTSLLPCVLGLSLCIVCWLRFGCRASLPVITSLAERPIRDGVLPLGPSSMRISSSGGGLLTKGIDARGGVLSAPMYHLLERPAQRTLFSDASKTAVGGYCLETGVYWRYDLTAQEPSRFCGSSKFVRGVDDLSINVLERLGMVVLAFILVSSCADRPSATGDWVLLRGDNEAAVHWVQRCRGGLKPRSGALMHLLGVLEVSSGWHFKATNVRGIHDAAADGISRWDRGSVLDHLRAVRPNIPWRVREIGTIGISLSTSVLATDSCDTPLRP